ncbi:DUF6624 domain-containing protein [Empedobacter stercoris]|uniref:Lipoprotein n=1 Tax=Empedobacter stercoris TaxID=1628248 RepID=A0ABX1WPZ0_9FLAO|nr:DUF6624 domain-containing protein [Empedobacter stercoris]NOJ76577.1 hypothetical protein [Empedobacter stercoris]
MKKIFILIAVTPIFLNCKTIKVNQEDKIFIKTEFENMRNIDQIYAGVPPKDLVEKYGKDESWEIFYKKRDSVNLNNQSKAKTYFNKYGFIGTTNFDKRTSGNFWIIVQHADNDIDFQKEVLKKMKREIRKNNAMKSQYAMLEDRVNVNLNKKQRFGSQVTYNENGQAIPINGLIDSTNIENIRKEYELPTFKQYYNEMTKMHFDMNKDHFIKKGMLQPKLYK